MLFSGAGDANIKCWDTTSTYCSQRTLQGHSQPILAMATSSGYLFSTGLDCSIHMWNTTNLTFVAKITDAHTKAVSSIAANGNYVFTGSLNIIKVWRFDSSNENMLEFVDDLSDVSNYVRALAINEDELYAGSTRLVTVWDIGKMRLKRQISVPGEVFSLLIIKGYILAGTDEKLIHVWRNDESKEFTCRLRGHVGTVHALASLTTGDSVRVFSASADRCLRVWSMENMLCAQVLFMIIVLC